MPTQALRVVVCGTDFGRTYLAALEQCPGFELGGILARGSDRSRRCAEHYGVPLYTAAGELPSTVDAACVVVGAGINGGPGGRLAQELMDRGLHVLQEHPLDQDELAQCLRTARRNRVVYHVNGHYVRLPAVARFVELSRRLRQVQQPRFVDAQGSFLVLYPLVEILASALAGVRPFDFSGPVTGPPLLRSLSGVLGGVPLSLRVQHQLDPVNRDNGAHVLQRITIFSDGGNLHLAGPAGPVIWSSRLHRPDDYAEVVNVAESADASLDLPTFQVLYPSTAGTQRHMVAQLWPEAVRAALGQFRAAIDSGEDPLPAGQVQLALTQVTREIVARLGAPELLPTGPPDIARAYAAVTG
jgi:pyochelin biosynthesis protein PchG